MESCWKCGNGSVILMKIQKEHKVSEFSAGSLT